MSKLELSQILGSSSSKPQHIAFAQDCLLYISGSFIIFYNAIVDEQICYLKHTSSLITSISVSPCQHLLVVCSTNNLSDNNKSIQSIGKKTNNNIITIYNLKQIGVSEPQLSICLRGHKYAIDHIIFSPDSKYLVSICNKDGSMFVWDCKTGQRLTQNKNSKNINSIKFLNPSMIQNSSRKDFGVYLVTTGRGTCKIWTFYSNEQPNILSRTKQQQQWILSGRAIALSKKFATKQFTDVCFWHSFILLLTSDGLLCLIAQSQKQQKLQKCIDLMMNKTYNMDIHQNTIICGGESALVKVIDLQTLTLVRKFPKPPPNKKQNIQKDYQQQQIQPYQQGQQFPQCSCIKTIGNNKFSQFIVTIYSNLTLFIWRPQPTDIVAMRSIITHQAPILFIKILQQFKNDLTFFSTISQDNTLRIWHIYKKCIYNRQSIDIAQLIGIKRNAYCRNLTRIIYMQSQKNVTCISGFRNKSVACIAHREFIMYSLENFQVACHEVLDCDALALEIKDNLAYIGLENGKIIIYEIIDAQDRLHKIRQIQFDNKIKKMKIVIDESIKNAQSYLLIHTQSEEGIIYSLKKSKIIHVEKGIKCTASSGHNILFCKSDNTIAVYNTQKQKYSQLISLKHEMTQISQSIKNISCNLIWIILITSSNKLIVCNFSPAVVCTEQFNESINDMVINDSGQIIFVGDYGNIVVYRMQGSFGYSGMEQQVKKWVQKNDMSWMDGSVWARKKSNDGGDRQLSGSIIDSVRLKSSINNRGSIKLQQLPNMQIKYKTDHNDQSIFNPSDILKQAKQIYKQIDGIQKKIGNNSNVVKPNQLQEKSIKQKKQIKVIGKTDQQDEGLEQIKVSFNKQSRPPISQSQNKQTNTKKRIFITQSKQPQHTIFKFDEQNQQEEGLPSQFRNNLVSSIIHTGQNQIKQDQQIPKQHQRKIKVTQSQKAQQSDSNKKIKSLQNKFNQFNEENLANSKLKKQQIRQAGQISKIFQQNYKNQIEKQGELIDNLIRKLGDDKFFQNNLQKFKQVHKLLSKKFQTYSSNQKYSQVINRSQVLNQFNKLSQQFIKYLSNQHNINK